MTARSASRSERALRRARPLMGTLVAVSVHAGSIARAERIERQVFTEMGRLAALLSEFEPASSVGQVNAASGIRAVPVPQEVLTVVEVALRVATASEGAFDPTWRPLADVWDFHRARVPSPRAVAQRLALVSYRDVIVDSRASRVMLRRAGMRLGLGGVAKAFVAERGAELGMALGATGLLVDAGGDVVARGTNGDEPWRVSIRDPRAPGAALGTLELHDGAVATSGDYERGFVAGGRRYHHLLDPRTGYPARRSGSLTVLARGGAEADALATALFVLGPKRGRRLVAKIPGVAAMWVAT